MLEDSVEVSEPNVEAVPESSQTQQETHLELEKKPEQKSSAEIQDRSQKDQADQEKQQERVLKKVKTLQINLNSSIKDQLNKHYLTSIPEFVQSSDSQELIWYTFRAPFKKQSSKLKQITAKPPPFYLLFDHTIAVVWTLFHKESSRDSLGIVQLHWALYCLESIYNTNNALSEDLLLCIETIRDYLIDAYSEMSEESAVYGNATLNDFATKEVSPIFSWNYSNMLSRCPVRIPDAETADSKLLEELENVKQLVGIQSIDLSHVQSYEQVMDILKKWQNEQTVKIEEDQKTLHVVEDMIRNLGEDNF